MYNINDTSQLNDKIEISDDTKIYIIDKLVEPYYKSIIKNTIQGRLCWRKSGIAFETISKIMVAFGSILSFSAGFYHDETLSFISGSISCLSLAFLQLSSFSYKENKKQSEELNILLKKLNLDTIPVFERQTETQARVYQSRQILSHQPQNPYHPNYPSYPTYPTHPPYIDHSPYQDHLSYPDHSPYPNRPSSSFSFPPRSMMPIRKTSINNYDYTDRYADAIANTDINPDTNPDTNNNNIQIDKQHNESIDIEAQIENNDTNTNNITTPTNDTIVTDNISTDTITSNNKSTFIQKTIKYLFEKNKDSEKDDE